jgi:hypothetical protein
VPRRLAALVAALVSVVTATVLTGAVTSQSVAAPRASCRPLASAAEWSATFRSLRGRWATADQATSIRLPDKRLLWLFGDTVQGQLFRSGPALGVRGWRMPHNSLVTTRGTTCDRIRIHTGPRGTSLIPDARNGDGHWPMSAVVDRGRLLVFTSRTRFRQGTFTGVGTRLAQVRFRSRTGTPATPVFQRWHATPSTGVGEKRGVQWGAAVEQRGGYTYVYGTRRSTQPGVFGKALHLARVRAGQLHRPQAWRFWNGRTWVASQARAVPVKEAVRGVSTTLSVHYVRGRWTAVTKEDEFLGRRIVMLTSAHPYGPWRETEIATTDTEADLARGDVTYTAMAHPEIRLASGRLLVTVSRNNLDPAVTLRDVERGRPYFFEAPWR